MTDTDDGPANEPFTPSGPWTYDEVVAFLDDAVIPVRLSCHTPSGGLWMLSLWYQYADGHLLCATGADADIVRFLRDDPHVAFEVSVNEPPYRGVRGRGTATLEADPEKTVLRELLERYLDGTDSALATRLLATEREEVTIRIDPSRVATWDYSERMADASE